MNIGIDASRAFLNQRTGIEEYSFQVINHLRNKLDGHRVVLYLRNHQSQVVSHQQFHLPKNWEVKVIRWSRLWTQGGLSWEMLRRPVDVLFVPAHTVPWIQPKNTIVTVHGLEYEFFPNAYPFLDRLYMRFSIKNSCRWAKKIIAVSTNSKKDLVNLYRVPEGKISVIHEGFEEKLKVQNATLKNMAQGVKPYLLFIGRLEERKNIIKIIEAYEILKEKNNIPHELVLIGKPGFGFEKIRFKILESRFKNDIKDLGYVSNEEKAWHLKNTSVFLFPTLYEGFGLPILEAQSLGVPVVASNNSSIPEVIGRPSTPVLLPEGEGGHRADEGASALLVDPMNQEEIAEAVYKILSDKNLRDNLIQNGLENVKRFSWEKCSDEVAKLLLQQ